MKMRIKLRGSPGKGKSGKLLDLPLEFEGERAFVIWDCIKLGQYQFKTRIEIDPRRLKKIGRLGDEFSYGGNLPLPRPQDN
jgi:hypothetical protein